MTNSMGAASESPQRTTLAARFSALGHRNFRLFWTGQLISLVGTWMQSVAQGWLMHRITHSAFWLGLLGFTQFFPVMLFSLWAGVIADRVNRRRLLLWTQSLFLLQAAALALLATTGVLSPAHPERAWMLLALAGFYGLVSALDMPTRQSFIVELVGKEHLPNAIALNSSAFNTARIVGPAVAGVLLAVVGEGGCFWLNALSYVAVIWSLTRIVLPSRESDLSGPQTRSTLMEGVRYAWTTRPIRNLLLLLGVTAGIGFQYQLLLPVYARDILHAGPKTYGLLVTAFGAGALLGALRLTGKQDRSKLRFNLLVGLGACGVGLAVFAWSRFLLLSLAAGALGGFGLIVYLASTNTMLQLMIEDRFRGRVMSLYTLMFAGTAPIGALAAGALAQRFGAPFSTSCSAVLMLLGALFVGRRLAALARLETGRVTEAAPTERLE